MSICRASVGAGGVDTEYLRAGRGGQVVLVLAANADHSRTAELLLRSLSASCCAIAPVIDGEPVDEGWLQNFVDGLGLGAVQIIAEEQFAAAARAFAASDPSRVERLSFVPGEPFDFRPPKP